MSLRKALFVWGFCLLTLISAFGQEVTERSRLGAAIEGVTYISSGSLAGHVAFIDCWGVYVCDLLGVGYEKIFSVEKISFGAWPRGIAYIGQGEFAGNFLLSDLTNRNTLFMVSSSGSLISEVHAQDFQWEVSCEGMTEISSGSYAGKMALVGFTGVAGGNTRHIYIFRMEKQSDGTIYAFIVKDLAQVNVPAPYDIYALSIAFLPPGSPVYPNHFLLGDVSGTIHVIDMEGIEEATFSGIRFMEGMTYIAGGIYQGKLFITDMTASGATVRNLDGSQSTPIGISVGGAGCGAGSITWLKDRRQMIAFSWSGLQWNWPMYLISRPYPGQWRKDAEFAYTQLRTPLKMTDMTSAGTYHLFGSVNSSPDKSPYEVHILDQ